MGKLSWTRKSAWDLESIHDYIAASSGSSFYAKRFVRSLIKATQKLESFPQCGRIVPELEVFGFREVIHKGYRIVYRLTQDDDVEVLAVVHGARDLERVFKEDWDI